MPTQRTTIDITISQRLKDILIQFENESQVASLLLKGRHLKEDLVDNPVNFISLAVQDPSKVSYLTVERILDLEKEPGVDFWTTSRRFQARAGSFIGKVFKNISGREVEKFSNLLKSQANQPKFNLSVVTGEDIRKYYYYESYQDCRGSLGNSCMKHDCCQKYMDVYVYNQDTVSMLIMTDDYGKLMGRSLLWNFDSYKIMDRIYTLCDEELQFHFKKWASDNGYLYKSDQNWYNTLNFESLKNKKLEIKIDIKLGKMDFRYFPYIDTFKFYNLEKGTLHNYIPEVNDRYNVRTLVAPDGSKFDYDYLLFDDISRVYRYRGEVLHLAYLDINTHQSNCCISDVNGKWGLIKDMMYHEELGDYIFNAEYDHLNNRKSIDERLKALEDRRKSRREKEEKASSIFSGFRNTLTIEDVMTRYSHTFSLDHVDPMSPSEEVSIQEEPA